MAELKRQAHAKIDCLVQHHQGVDLLVRYRDIKGGRIEETDWKQDVIVAGQIPGRANGDGNEYPGGDVRPKKVAPLCVEFRTIAGGQQSPRGPIFDDLGEANPRKA